MYYARVFITLKKSIADPQGNAIKEALLSMKYDGVEDVRMGKLIELKLENPTREEAEENLKDMCEKLLANTVIEDYSYEILEV
ncbi:MAG: Phosphoribosylformylglycinamidine synthase, PurS subunit [Firmicutes bacterium]|nr:Phosphoribosylformylglycinamidine synthase, PurS subunit [Bacillota bacterium]MDI6706162.1 phosphoribosylformylglycinamidine synthase subunit PurS [Bacillota bacterium]